MTFNNINVGLTANDGLGDKLRNAFIIVNENFSNIEDLLNGNDVLTISQITGLQTALNNINSQLSYIPGLQADINSINDTILTINDTLNSQNNSIADINNQITNLQNQIYTKIEEAPIDGLQYARKDGGWVVVSGGGTGATPSLQEVIAVNPVSSLGFTINDGAGSVTELTSNIVSVNNPGGSNYSYIQDGFVTMNFTTAKRIDITADGVRFKNPDNGYASIVPNATQVAGVTPTYQLPNKISNSLYTLATTDMISSTPSLQQVTNVGNSTTNSIQFNTGIFITASKVINVTSGYINLISLNQGAMLIEWNRILFPSSNNIASSVVLGSTGNGGTNFWLPGYKSNFSTPQILTTQEDSWVPFSGNSNEINIFKSQNGNTFSTATFYSRGLTSSNGSITISSTGSNTSTSWAWDTKVNPNLILDSLTFNTASTTTGAVGRFVWNNTDGTLDLGLKGGNVTLQVGQEQLVRVVNKTTTNITLQESAYQAVRVTGAQGQRLKVDLAQATSDLLSAETIGLVTETILNNEEGFVTISGLVNKINTTGSLQGETWLDGDILYLSPTTPGMITNIKPSAPDHMVIIGYVVYSHAINGKIFVKVNNGYELDELHNVKIIAPTASHIIQYDPTLNIWTNKQLYSSVFNDITNTTGATQTNVEISRSGDITLYGSTRYYRTLAATGSTNGTVWGHVSGGQGLSGFVSMFASGSNYGAVNTITGCYASASSTESQLTFTSVKNSSYDKWNDNRLLFRFQNGFYTNDKILDISTNEIQIYGYTASRIDTGFTPTNYLTTDDLGVLRSRPITDLGLSFNAIQRIAFLKI